MLRRSSSPSLSAAALGAAFLFAALLPAAPVRAQEQNTTDRARQQRMEQRRQQREAERRERMKERRQEIQARVQRNAAAPAEAVNEQDSLALVALYESTDGDNWDNNDGWLEAPVAYWYGVTVSGDRVVGLDLERLGLSGSLPPEMGDLTAPQNLNLRSNQLTGQIPPGAQSAKQPGAPASRPQPADGGPFQYRSPILPR
jgi:hypothetical protein